MKNRSSYIDSVAKDSKKDRRNGRIMIQLSYY